MQANGKTGSRHPGRHSYTDCDRIGLRNSPTVRQSHQAAAYMGMGEITVRRLLQRLKTVQNEALPHCGGDANEALLVAVATVLHEGGIVAAPTGDEKRCLGVNAPRVKAGRPRK